MKNWELRMEYRSCVAVESKCRPGVLLTIRRMSFGRRIELTRQIRELARKVEFLEAGGDTGEKIESALLKAEIEKLYLAWGLVKVEGLEVDGTAATPESLLSEGPEDVCREAIAAIKAECGLTDDERKN